jgi:hypothetical protein
LHFCLGSGSTRQTTKDAWQDGYYIATSSQISIPMTGSADFGLADVQLEIGSVATPLEYVDYNKDLLACRRYHLELMKTENATGDYLGYMFCDIGNTSYCYWPIYTMEPMRGIPTVSVYDVWSGIKIYGTGGGYPSNAAVASYNSTMVTLLVSYAGTASHAYMPTSAGKLCRVRLTSEI